MAVSSRQIKVARVVSSRRYSDLERDYDVTEDLFLSPNRPANWEERLDGCEVIESVDGEQIQLWSDGMQSTPKPGWVILTTGGSQESGYTWTLYAMPPKHLLP
jgi:hypothetical protein